MQNKYEAMLPRLAAYAARHPGLYRARVTALAWLGYGVIVGLLLALVVLEIVLVVVTFNTGELALIKLILPLAVFIGILAEALWIEMPAPKGLAVSRTEAPALWAEIDRVRKAMRAPAPYQVLIDGEFNASVSQVPRLGIFGFYRTYLTIGLPLAASLTPDEFRAVLAHEFGHVSRRHGRSGAWIYRIQMTWNQVLESLEQSRHWTRGVFRSFLRWYAPFFDAYTAVLRRAHEFEADRAAAGVAGSGTAATALCRVDVAARYLDASFWPAVMAQIPRQTMAPTDVFHRLLGEMPGAADRPEAAGWLREQASRTTEPWDTHPSLAERLASLGAAPAVPSAPARPTAAEAFFGAHAEKLAERLGRRWADSVQFTWRQQHDEHLQMARRLATLEAQAQSQPLAMEEARERIYLTVQLHGQTVAMPLMRGFVDAGADDATVHFLLGQALLEEEDDAGLRHLDRAMTMDIDLIPRGTALAAGFLDARGRRGEGDAYRRRAEAHAGALQLAQAERDPERLSPSDRFLPHGLSPDHARALAGQVAAERSIKRALLVRKDVVALPEVPCFILALEFRAPDEFAGAEAPLDMVVERVARRFAVPGTLTLVQVKGSGKLARALAAVPGADLSHGGAPAGTAAR